MNLCRFYDFFIRLLLVSADSHGVPEPSVLCLIPVRVVFCVDRAPLLGYLQQAMYKMDSAPCRQPPVQLAMLASRQAM